MALRGPGRKHQANQCKTTPTGKNTYRVIVDLGFARVGVFQVLEVEQNVLVLFALRGGRGQKHNRDVVGKSEQLGNDGAAA